MALTDLTRISTAGIATGSTIDSPILRKDVDFRGDQVGVTSVLFDSSEKRLDLKDNVNLTFGDDGDLKLYHNGSHSYIDETGAGNLYIRNGTKNSIWCKTDGQVNLYFNDEKKFETAETGAKVTGILTATSFSGPIVGNTNNSSGISTFYDLRVSNNLTVEGTTTTIDTNLINVDRIEVGANSDATVAVSIAQTGSADIVNLFDGTTEVLTVTDGGKVGIGNSLPTAASSVLTVAPINSTAGRNISIYTSGSVGNKAGLFFNATQGTGNLAEIQAEYKGTNQGELVFSTSMSKRITIQKGGNVGIGVTNPLRKLDVVGDSLLVRPTAITTLHSSGNANAVNNSIIVRMPYGENAASTSNAGARFGIQFTGANNTTDVPSLNWGDDPTKSASIYGVSEDDLGYNRKVGMVFYTSNFDIAQLERLRIASDGKVAMGLTSTSGGKCDPDGNHLLIRGASTVGTKNGHIMLTGDSATLNQGPQIVFSESGSGANWAGAYIGHQRKGGGSQGDLVFATRQETGDADTVPVEVFRITSTAKLKIAGSRGGALQANDDDTLKLYTKSTNNNVNRGAGITFYIHDNSDFEMGGTIQVAKENGTIDNVASYMRFSTRPAGGDTTERLRILSTGGTKLTRTTVGGQESLGNTSNLWWKVGTWAGTGVDAAARATLTILGANTHNANNPAGGETKIYLSGTGSTIYATYYSITDKHEGLNGVATKYDQSSSSCEVWVRYGSGGYGSNCVYADVTSGFFTGANVNTSSTTIPSGATLGSSKFSVRTSDNSNSKERLAIDQYGHITIPGQQTGITTSAHRSDAPLQVITGANGNTLNLRARAADNAYVYINFQDNAGDGTSAEMHMQRNSQNGGQLVFGTTANNATAPTKRLTIDKDGTFIVGDHDKTALAVHDSSSRGLNATVSGRVYCKTDDHWDLNHVGTGEIIRFRKGNDNGGGATQTHVGDIEILSSGVRYDESASDSRLKKNIETWTDEVLPHFKTLQPKKFNFNWESDSDTKTKGYMAQDVTSAFPEAFHLGKIDIGETDSNGDSVDSDRYKFSPGKMVPYLMKALQEEIAKREALEARISALEGS